MTNTYSYYDPNGGVTRVVDGDSYTIFGLSFCATGTAIKIYLAGAEVMYSCCDAATLKITPKTVNYDCINGNCVPKSTYNTPGIYTSLADCQAVCANGGACGAGKQCIDPTNFCPPGKVCIEQGEFSSIEALISQIGSEVC